MSYFKNRETLAAFVNDQVMRSNASLPWTMIIGQDKSGDYYAHFATVESSDVTDSIRVMNFSAKPMNTSQQTIPDG